MASPATATPSGGKVYTQVEHDGWTAESNTQTEEQMREALGAPSVDEEKSDAGATLGKKGGEAAAKARKAKPKAEAKPAESEDDEEATDEADEKAAKVAKADEKKAKAAEEDESEDEPEEAVKTEAEVKEQRKRDARTRVLEATRKAAELTRENRRLADELAAERATRAQPKPVEKRQEAAAQDDDPEPKVEDYEDYAEGVKAQAQWAARKEFKKLQGEDQKRRQATEYERAFSQHSQVVEGAIKKAGGEEFLKDISDDVLTLEPSYFAWKRGERPGPEHIVADEIIRSGEHAPRLMRYLTEHPDVYQRLTSPTLSPREFAREMGRIEERLSAATAGNPAPKPSSKAPRPARPVAGSPTNADAEPDADDSYDEHVSYWNAKERRRTA